jgi:RimJ/RimL family protein N-acetyltransferase
VGTSRADRNVTYPATLLAGNRPGGIRGDERGCRGHARSCGPINREQSDKKLDRYAAAYHRFGFCRWVVESTDGRFLGYAGIMPSPRGHPLGNHFEIGWRLVRSAWGCGYATEAAKAALRDAFARPRLKQVLAYTAPDNIKSQAAMVRLGLQRDASLDFTALYEDVGVWQGWFG